MSTPANTRQHKTSGGTSSRSRRLPTTSISFHPTILEAAQKRAHEEGFVSFSPWVNRTLAQVLGIKLSPPPPPPAS